MVWLGDIPVATLRPNSSSGIDIYYVHADRLNAPRKISRTNDNKLVWRGDSDPFENTPADENPSGLGTFSSHLAFPGHYLDVEMFLYENGARYYDPAAGRYFQSDPIGLNGGVNTYAYALGNPISNYDTNGLEVICGNYYCGTTVPAYPEPPGLRHRPLFPCERCQGDDKLSIRIDATACSADDTSCFLAMQASGIAGPYTPHTNHYSKECLFTVATIGKPAEMAGNEALRKGVPAVISRAGAARAAAGIAEFLEYSMGWEATVAFAPFAIMEIGDRCQCEK
jgi:RHS repeat-associated protein